METNERNVVTKDVFEILSFELSKRDFAVDVDFVEMVIERSNITFVPKAQHYIKGVMNLRGRIVPIIDLSILLGIDGDTESTKILVLKIKDIEVGFLVDEVKEVIRISSDDIDKLGSVEDMNQRTKGIIKSENRLIVYLDAEKIIEI